MRVSVLTLFLAGCLLAALPAYTAEPAAFSAEIVTHDPAGTAAAAPAHLFRAGNLVRIETPEAAGGFFLVDGDRGEAWFVQPQRRLFSDARTSTRLIQLFVPVDPAAPCVQWQAARERAGGTPPGTGLACERLADERGLLAFRVTAPDQSSERWVDARLRFPVRIREADGTTVTLEAITAGTPPGLEFTVPDSYRRLDPEALLQRIRRSDVWADPGH